MNRQRGVTLSGLIIVLVLIILVLLLGFKLVPVYLEYSTIQKIFQNMSEDPLLRGKARRDMDFAWAARATVEDIRSIDGTLIDYTKEPDGGWIISAEYAQKESLFRNVALCFDFKPTSSK